MKNKDVDLIKDADCVNCTACKYICPVNCIEMSINEEGFSRPVIDYNICIKCGRCYQTCPSVHISSQKKKPAVLAMINRENEVRMKSSSGGVFYNLARWIINQEGLVCAASLNQNGVLKHIIINNIEDIEKCTKSKYVESALNDVYIEIKKNLDGQKKILFVGTPCQVYGLQCFLGKEYEQLYLVDLVCHGVPSPKVWAEYLEDMEKEKQSSILDVSFRDMSIDGWKNFGMRIKFANGEEYVDTQDQNWFMFGFLQGYINRKSCYQCKYKGLNRRSDITLADFWGVDDYIKRFNDNKGTSLVYVNSNKGIEIIKAVREEFFIRKITVKDFKNINTAYISSSQNIENRDYFFKKYSQKKRAKDILRLKFRKELQNARRKQGK